MGCSDRTLLYLITEATIFQLFTPATKTESASGLNGAALLSETKYISALYIDYPEESVLGPWPSLTYFRPLDDRAHFR